MSRFVAALLLATMAVWPLPALAASHPTETNVFSGADALLADDGVNVIYDEQAGGLRLGKGADGNYARHGIFTLDIPALTGYNRAVPSWNAHCPPGTWIAIEMATSEDTGVSWSNWVEVARWGERETLKAVGPAPAGAKGDKATPIRVDEDTLEAKAVFNRVQLRVRMNTEAPGQTPLLSLLAVTMADRTREVEADDSRTPSWGQEVTTEFRSQGWEDKAIASRICGPTSTTMMLTTYGISLPTAFVAARAFDELNDIYGNWPFLAATASDLFRQNADRLVTLPSQKKVFAAWVDWAPDWKRVEEEIAGGHPCIVSIRFKEGELKNAPIASTNGHLILVKGFTSEGNPIVHDPAAKDASKGRIIYDRQELHRARHGNPIIVFHPVE